MRGDCLGLDLVRPYRRHGRMNDAASHRLNIIFLETIALLQVTTTGGTSFSADYVVCLQTLQLYSFSQNSVRPRPASLIAVPTWCHRWCLCHWACSRLATSPSRLLYRSPPRALWGEAFTFNSCVFPSHRLCVCVFSG